MLVSNMKEILPWVFEIFSGNENTDEWPAGPPHNTHPQQVDKKQWEVSSRGQWLVITHSDIKKTLYMIRLV